MTGSDLPTPLRWADPAWQGSVLAWADDRLASLGRRRTGVEQPHSRAWSTVLRIDTDADPVWLKANGDGTVHEAALLQALADLDVPMTPRPLAVDIARGWTLLPDGGPTSRESHGGRTPLPVLETLLADHAQVQRATEPHVTALLDAGAEDVRPARMPALLAGTVDRLAAADPDWGLRADDAARLRGLLPAYARACAELDAIGVPVALQHDDLHDANVFARGPVFFDWGDAVVGHPFGTMLATLRSVGSHHGLAPDDPALARIADVYTEAWTDVADRATLRRAVRLAVRVGPLTRSLAWLRGLDGADRAPQAEYASYAPSWLLELEADDLPLLPDPLR